MENIVKKPKQSMKAIFKPLFPCIKGYRLKSILAPIFIMVEVLFEVLIPTIMSDIVNLIDTSYDFTYSEIYVKLLNFFGVGVITDEAYIIFLGALMAFFAVLSLITGSLSAKFAAEASSGVAKNLRASIFNKLQDFSFANIDKFSTASLVVRCTTDVTYIQQAYGMLIRIFIRAPFMFICAIIMSIRINGELALVFLVAAPILAIGIALIMISVFPKYEKMFKKYDAMDAGIQENLIGVRVVKSFVRENKEIEKFDKTADDVRSLQYSAERLGILVNPLMQGVLYISIVLICWFGANLIVGGSMGTGDLSSFIIYVNQILFSLMLIAMVFINVVICVPSASRISEVLSEKIDITDTLADPNLTVEDGSIEFKNVSFGYAKQEGNSVLTNVNLKIASGQKIGIIGGTGSAKTTLVQLIPRLYDVTGGEVFVSGHDVREYKLDKLRDSVSMVLQNNVLFSGTIKSNLLWGDVKASQEDIERAAKAACAHDFIMSFKDGYDTDLGQGGVNVSGGQKQRLCIARALLKDPKILILDDSTSAVDTATDKTIRSSFDSYYKDTTVIIIAQRIASVIDSDYIIVMDDGKINGVGTHEELMKNNEIYRDVFTSQQQGVE